MDEGVGRADGIPATRSAATDGSQPPSKRPRRGLGSSLAQVLTPILVALLVVASILLATSLQTGRNTSAAASASSRQDPVTAAPATGTGPPSSPATGTRTPSSPATVTPAPTDIAWILAEVSADMKLGLAPLPPDAPPARIDEQEAVAIVLAALGRDETTPVFVDHGIGKLPSEETAAVWLVAYAITDGVPYPIEGPMCPDMRPCPVFAVDDFAGAMVSDQTGELLRSFSASHLVSPPPEPSSRP